MPTMSHHNTVTSTATQSNVEKMNMIYLYGLIQILKDTINGFIIKQEIIKKGKKLSLTFVISQKEDLCI